MIFDLMAIESFIAGLVWGGLAVWLLICFRASVRAGRRPARDASGRYCRRER
jgi:hypothetical protein